MQPPCALLTPSPYTISLAKHNNGCAAAALIRRRFAEALDVRMTFQQCADGALQSALAVTMNDADAFDARQIGVVKILVDAVGRFIHRCANHIQLAGEILIYVKRSADATRQIRRALRRRRLCGFYELQFIALQTEP